MKKYIQNRNEQLFNRLFESQDIKPNLGEVCNSDEAEELIQEESSGASAFIIGPIEADLRIKLKRMMASGTDARQMAAIVKELHDEMPNVVRNMDAMAGYVLAGQGYISPLEGIEGIKELGIPEMAAWQHLEEGERESEGENDG